MPLCFYEYNRFYVKPYISDRLIDLINKYISTSAIQNFFQTQYNDFVYDLLNSKLRP